VTLERVLTDRGTEYCGGPERHEFELYLAVENIDHPRVNYQAWDLTACQAKFYLLRLNRSDPRRWTVTNAPHNSSLGRSSRFER